MSDAKDIRDAEQQVRDVGCTIERLEPESHKDPVNRRVIRGAFGMVEALVCNARGWFVIVRVFDSDFPGKWRKFNLPSDWPWELHHPSTRADATRAALLALHSWRDCVRSSIFARLRSAVQSYGYARTASREAFEMSGLLGAFDRSEFALTPGWTIPTPPWAGR